MAGGVLCASAILGSNVMSAVARKASKARVG
jgi:hypothetical protein